MRNCFFVFSALAISGCVATGMYFDKPGMAPGSGQGDVTDCEVEAANKVMPNTQLRTLTGYGDVQNTYSVDTNAALRDRVLVQCMAKRGYKLRQ